MINEILTNSNWLNPQIDFLLFCQNLRLYTGGIFDNFFFSLTLLGQFLLPTALMCIIYWCIDTAAGTYLFVLNSMCILAIQVMKNVACVYRPWILTDRLNPLEKAIKTAGGYSFPSGHSIGAASIWGGLAFLTRKKKLLCAFFIFLILLIGFSRCYLCVHTPQDVVIGILSGVFFIFFGDLLLKWCEKDKNRYMYFLALMDLIIAIVFVWVLKKHYPMDYIDGKILVDPHKAIYVSVIYIAWVLGMLNGILIRKRYIDFDAKKGSLRAKILRGIVGLITFGGLFYVIETQFMSSIQHYKPTFLIMSFTGFYVTAIYPFIISKLQKYIDI